MSARPFAPLVARDRSALLDLLETDFDLQTRRLRTLKEREAPWLARWRQIQKTRRARQMLDWATSRAEGQASYVWRRGLLRYGLATFFFLETVLVLLQDKLGPREAILFVPLGAVAGMVAGLIVGLINWDRRELQFDRTIASLSSDAPEADGAPPRV